LLRQRLLWRLRNRLIVTYVFIGVIPAVLLVVMTGLQLTSSLGQFANFVVTSDINAELKNLETANLTVAHSIANHLGRKDTNKSILQAICKLRPRSTLPRSLCLV